MRPMPVLLTGAALLLGVHATGPAAAQTTILGAESLEAAPGVRVLRGSAIKPKPAPKRTAPLAAAAITSGETFWAVDRTSGRLIACEREYGINVGQSIVRCTPGQLPLRLRAPY